MRKRRAKDNRSRIRTFPFTDSLGQTFHSRRQDRGLTLAQVTAEIKIRRDYLAALEKADFQKLPHTVHSLGFVRRYANFLGLDGQTAVKKYLLERGPLPPAPPRQTRQRVSSPVIGSRILGLGVLSVGALLVVAYIIIQLVVLAGPPRLSLSHPLEGQIIRTNVVEVRGQTTPGAEVSVNGQLIYIDEAGRFVHELSLPPGLNKITVEARNSRGQLTRLERNVVVD